jgi:DNA-binding transcriptional LysR family regulator
VDLRHLRYFVVVAEELNFTRAARRLHIAQPPLSRQIRELEDQLGVTLINRTLRQIELTDAGQVFLVKAKQVLRAAESAVVETQRAQRGETGTLAVGFFEQAAYTLLPPILRAFNERFPEVDVQLRWFPVVSQIEALMQGEIDIAFLRPVVDLSGVRRTLLLEEPFLVAVSASHPFARKRIVSLEECASERIINYTQSLAPDYHAAIIRACAVAGFIPNRPIEVGQVYTALGLVSAGVGIAFAPSSVQRVQFGGIVYKPLKGTPLISEVYQAWLQPNPSAVLHAFLEVSQRVMKEEFARDVLRTPI